MTNDHGTAFLCRPIMPCYRITHEITEGREKQERTKEGQCLTLEMEPEVQKQTISPNTS